MLSERIHKIAQGVGQFLLTQNNGDYDKTWENILRLQIVSITEENNVATITTCRPGILIGIRGKLIKDLEVFLKENCGVDGIKIVEDKDCLQDCIMPQKEYDESLPSDWYLDDLEDSFYDYPDEYTEYEKQQQFEDDYESLSWFHEEEPYDNSLTDGPL